MVHFTEDYRERMRRKLAHYQEVSHSRTVSTLKVVVEKGDNQLASVTVPGKPHRWSSDEGGPSPLAYFLASVAQCQCVHYAEHAAAEEIQVDALRVEVEGAYSLSVPRRFERIVFTVRLDSPEQGSRIERLFRTATEDCFVTGTLQRACEMRGTLFHNGQEAGTFTAGPSP